MATAGAEPLKVTPVKVSTGSAVSKFLLDHAGSSLKVLAGSTAAAAAYHLAKGGTAGVDLTTLTRTTTLTSLVWSGMVLGIGALEAWVKFHAPSITRPLALDVGRHVFSALNKVEIALSVALVYCLGASAASGQSSALPSLTWVPPALVALESVSLLPALLRRAQAIVSAAASGVAAPKGSPAVHVSAMLVIFAKIGVLLHVGAQGLK
eukprot:CAMPEP_0202921086 /NCGR_PEP_ID=MMETSP1392-20130828/77206_1 /ASSEMBLY_ACC=CAM_ASM_000868 /TAXON_ID=225041 /ORGANISM="Chlamydomonas chlamydogama, Strain SAG 11-48b" /LENGTH=207 /DNA_ID=CAMNT_0049614629 /DNA_START=277 /DNA_END=900 /DNA_ORIENTATION=-